MPPLLKTLRPVLVSTLLATATTQGAVIIANEVLLTIADGGASGPWVSAETACIPTNAWHRWDLPMPQPGWPSLDFGWQGMGGGRVTIQTDPGETVSTVDLSFGEGPNGPGPWNFHFKGYGETQDIQIWESVIETLPGGGSNVWVVPPFNQGTTAPFYFEVVTSSGAVGNQYYAVSLVPEPTAALMTALGGLALLRRRR